jgi:hypothetical protein
MDPLSGAASVIAVVSLVVQVCGSIKKLNDFRNSIKNAPPDIVQLSDQLIVLDDILQAVLRKVQATTDSEDPRIDKVHPLHGPLRICQNIEIILKRVITKLETRYQKHGAKNLWTSMMASWKKGRIEELKQQLSFACQLLILRSTLGGGPWQFECVFLVLKGFRPNAD